MILEWISFVQLNNFRCIKDALKEDFEKWQCFENLSETEQNK